MEKKAFLATAFLSVLLLSAVAGTQLVTLARGNPFSQSQYSGERSPSVKVNPPEVSVLSPQNDRIYNTRDVLLTLSASTKGSQRISVGGYHYISGIGIKEVYFTADWLQNKIMIYRSRRIGEWIDNKANFFFMGDWYEKYDDLPEIDFEKLSLNLTDVPDGNHTMTVYAVGSGSEHYIFNWYVFYVTGFSKVNFVVDTTPPKVSLLHLEKETHETSDVSINFTVNEPASLIKYSLDGQKNATFYGNTSLTGLASGKHNITLYVWDKAGNLGVSKTTYFSVSELEPDPFPTTIVIAPIASVAVVGVSLMVYFEKRKR